MSFGFCHWILLSSWSVLSVLRKVTRKEDGFDGNGGQSFMDHVYDNIQVWRIKSFLSESHVLTKETSFSILSTDLHRGTHIRQYVTDWRDLSVWHGRKHKGNDSYAILITCSVIPLLFLITIFQLDLDVEGVELLIQWLLYCCCKIL